MQLTDDDKRRMGYIGSRDVAAILGVSEYETAWDVWNFKKNGIKKIFTEEAQERMRWGLLLEDIVISECARLKECQIIDKQKHIRHDKYNFIGGTLDAIFKDEFGNLIMCEAKTTHTFNKNYNDELPDDVYLQAQHNMGLSGAKMAFVPVLIGGQKQIIHALEFDQEIYETGINRSVYFWENYVVGNRELKPNLDKIEAKKDAKICGDPAVYGWVKLLNQAKQKKKSAEEQEEFYKKSIKEYMGENEILCDNDWKNLVTWKQYEKSELNGDAVKKFLGEKVKDFTKTTTQRTLRILA